MKFLEFLNHERYHVLTICLVLLILFVLFSCESQVTSLITPTEKVNRGELQLELDTYFRTAELRFKQLDQQDLFKQQLHNFLIPIAQGGAINWTGLVISLGGLLGIGAEIDNVRRRKEAKANVASTSKTAS